MQENFWHAFENEYIIVSDDKNVPVNYIWDTKTSTAILNIIKKSHPELINSKQIWWELDACQIEIKNSKAFFSIEESQEELLKLFSILESTIIDEFWLQLATNPYPNQNYQSVFSDTEARYSKIHRLLMQHWEFVRKWTNVAWLHYHLDMDPEYQNYIKIAKHIKDLFDTNRSHKLLPSLNRHESYIKVVEALSSEWMVNNWRQPIVLSTKQEILDNLFDIGGIPKFNYAYVGIKRPWGLTTEVRTMDAPHTEEQLLHDTSYIHNYIKDLLS